MSMRGSQSIRNKTESSFHQPLDDVTMSSYDVPAAQKSSQFDSRHSQMPQQSSGPRPQRSLRESRSSTGPPRIKSPKVTPFHHPPCLLPGPAHESKPPDRVLLQVAEAESNLHNQAPPLVAEK